MGGGRRRNFECECVCEVTGKQAKPVTTPRAKLAPRPLFPSSPRLDVLAPPLLPPEPHGAAAGAAARQGVDGRAAVQAHHELRLSLGLGWAGRRWGEKKEGGAGRQGRGKRSTPQQTRKNE